MGGFVARIIKPRPVAPAIQREAVKAAPSGPTIAEMQQGTRLTRAAVGRRGRRATILTSSKGVDEDLTLGYKTLLG